MAPGVFWRIIFAVIGLFFVWQLLPPLMVVLGLTLSAAALKVLQLCISAIAVFYVLRGPKPPWTAVP